MSLPYYKRFPRDFLEGTIGLSFEVKGAFAIVLDLIYMRDGRLPDDARYIAGQLGCSVRKWTAIREALIEGGKLMVQDGIISNFRADYLTEESRKYQDKQAEIAGKPRKNKPLRQPQASQSEPEPETEEASSSVVPLPPRPKPSRRAPDDWSPKETTLSTLMAEGYDSGSLERALAMVRDHEFAKPKTDWDATYRIWVRRDPPRGNHGKSASFDRSDARHQARLDNHADHWTGAERAADVLAARRSL